MKNYLNRGDFQDLFLKIYEKGFRFLFAKFKFQAKKRTQAAFSLNIKSSNWWIIPEVKQRWNAKITGDKNLAYEDFLIKTYFKNQSNLTLLSIGCGVGNHEIKLAQSGIFSQIKGIDIASNSIEIASKKAQSLGADNCSFETIDILKDSDRLKNFDIVLFHSSLHHFDKIANFLEAKIEPILKQNGQIIIFEYAGPSILQWTDNQINTCNKILKNIPEKYKKTRLNWIIKNRVFAPGLLRMKLADPSEAIDSLSILPVMKKRYKVCYERPFGGNVLHPLFKDIAHNFLDDSQSTKELIIKLFKQEDEYLKTNQSDFVFGIYQLK